MGIALLISITAPICIATLASPTATYPPETFVFKQAISRLLFGLLYLIPAQRLQPPVHL